MGIAISEIFENEKEMRKAYLHLLFPNKKEPIIWNNN